MLCALIQNNLVCGVVDFTDEQINIFSSQFEQIVDISNLVPQPQIGWAFDGSNISGTAVSLKITRLAMRQRFTTGELLAIMTYVNANPASVVAILMQNLQVATYIDLSRSDTQAGIEYLASLALVTSQRAGVILNTIPNASEIYEG
jgi:hypothetical protein